MKSPPYIPDLGPSDYYRFTKLETDIRQKILNNADDVKREVMTHFKDKASDYFFMGICCSLNYVNSVSKYNGIILKSKLLKFPVLLLEVYEA